MKIYLWYSKATSVSGRGIALSMGLRRNSSLDRNREYGTAPPPIGTTHCIVYGARMRNWIRDNYRWKRNIKWLNKPELVEQFSNKYHAMYRMYMHNVELPEFSNKEDRFELMHDILLNTGIEFDDFSNKPIIGRTNYHHGGSGFEFITNEEQLSNSNKDYFMEYLDGKDKREYRVHVFRGEVVRVQRKLKKRDEEGNVIEPTDYICRSHDNGWRFSLRDKNRVHPSIINNSIRAVSSLGYDFGAVDIIRIPSQDKTAVLEVNSGMGLDNSGIELYTGLFNDWLYDENFFIGD